MAKTTSTTPPIKPFHVHVAQRSLDDLHRRLKRTRWAPQVPGTGWERGVPTDYLREVADYWRGGFDWRGQETFLNQFAQFTTDLQGAKTHFLHVRSPEPDATPLMLLHGWPGSIVEFIDVIGPLTDPVAHGGRAADAFHVVVPSLPGYGFSGPLPGTGWNDARTAEALAELMPRLGYEHYGVHGGDVGAFLAPRIGRLDPDRVIGVHVNNLLTFPAGDKSVMSSLSDEERGRLAGMKKWQDDLGAYMQLQGTRPQTIAAALNDSPVGQLAWIIEKFKDWTNPDLELPEDAVALDRILTDVSIYWFTQTAGSSAGTYYERFHDPSMRAGQERGTVPTAVAVYPGDFSIRPLAEQVHDVAYWAEFDKGGHFAALEVPDVFVADLRAAFEAIRKVRA